MHSLEAKLRSETAKETRLSGDIPGVVYGKDVPSKNVSVSTSDFTRLFREAGQNHVFTLKAGKESFSVLVHEIQKHPVSGKPLHIDFLTINMKEKITVRIPIILTGTSPAVIAGGQLHQTLETLEVKCLPNDVVDGFEIDVSLIDHIGKSLHVSDVKVDTKKFEVLTHALDPVVSAHAVKEHSLDTEQTSVADVGVATEKKKDEEGAE